MFGQLKDWRGIAMRFCRCAHTFDSFVCLALIQIFLCPLNLEFATVKCKSMMLRNNFFINSKCTGTGMNVIVMFLNMYSEI